MKPITWKEIASDKFGNKRYVCDYNDLLSDSDFRAPNAMNATESYNYIQVMRTTQYAYKIAIKRANKIGGRKHHSKLFARGIAFKGRDIKYIEQQIKHLLKVLLMNNTTKHIRTIDKIITKVSGKYGAPMGRPNVGTRPSTVNNENKIFDCAVPMSADGAYDRGGAYWGIANQLRVSYTKDLSYIEFYRYPAIN